MSHHIDTSEYISAMKSVKRARSIFILLIILALVVQAAGFVLMEFTSLMDVPADSPRSAEASTTQPDQSPPTEAEAPTTQPAESQSSATHQQAENLREIFKWALPATKFAALVSGVLLVITLMFSVGLCLIIGGGGAMGLASAFFWSLILLAAVTPWQQVLGGSMACGALYNMGELMKLYDATRPALMDKIFYYARFLGFPGLALLVGIAVLLKSSRGFGRIISAGAKQPPAGV